MSASASRRGSTSDSPVSSALARAPNFSPPSTRNVSPVRRPLHDRSNSQTNQYAGPTIRIVQDPGSDVYSKTPFPSEPSHILPPRNAPGYAFERRGSGVSDRSSVANAVAKLEAAHTLAPKPLLHKRAIRHSTSTSTSDADTIVASSFSPSSTRFSQGSTPSSSPPPPDFLNKEKGLEPREEVPSSPLRSTIRAVTPSTSSSADVPFESHALTPRASAASLASTPSAASPTHHQRGPSSISIGRLSAKSHKYTLSTGSQNEKRASSSNTVTQRPNSTASTQSVPGSDTSFLGERPRSASQPSPTLHEARTATLASGVRINYPVVRAPSSSSLWAESQDVPTITSRMNSRPPQAVHHWSSQLSTIPSESERGSRSIERASHSLSGRSHSQSQDEYPPSGRAHIPRRRQTIGSVSSSDRISDVTESSEDVVVPLPLFSPITGPSNDDRESDERHDTISPLQSPPLRMKRSGFLRRWDSDSRSTASSRPSSSQSDLSTFVSSTIPAWARFYYRRGERASLGAPESLSESSESFRLPTAQSGRTGTPSDGNFPLSIYRPRNRPHNRISQPDTISISDDLEVVEQDVYVVGPRRPQDWTPRLRPDRRSQAQLSAWKAPSFDENFGSMLFSRQNRQILMFCFGFIFPFAWMIASFLPLPPDPELSKEATPSQTDLERHFAREIGPVEDKAFRKATWWRNLNRIMSGIGTLLIGVIIALAILASRMS